MDTVGQQLRAARERKELSPSQIASATRMKVQIVEDIENDDFSRIVAPIYAKGFIKLYAEYVGLEPAPLVQQYMAADGAGQTRSLHEDYRAFAATADNGPEPADGWRTVRKGLGRLDPRNAARALARAVRRLPELFRRRTLAAAAGTLIVLLAVSSVLRACAAARRRAAPAAVTPPSPNLIAPPPPAYLP